MFTKRIKTNITLNGNNIEYKSNRDKDKNLSPKEYLDTIKLYLSNIIKESQKIENSANKANQFYFF